MDRREQVNPEFEPGPEAAKSPSPVRRNELVYAVLHDSIVNHQLPLGLVLTESAVSRAFNVSRSPAAAALKRLRDEGQISDYGGRGFTVGRSGLPPKRMDLMQAGLKLEGPALGDLEKRGWRDLLYPQVEREVAACLAFGNFRIVGAALADHFGVSRTVAHELLTRLERVGIITQAANGHWYAPQLTTNSVREHYQIRYLLEPVALTDAMRFVAPEELAPKLAKVEVLLSRNGDMTETDVTQIEHDLHADIVLRCSNQEMRRIIHRSQLPLIATHLSFARYSVTDEIRCTLLEHKTVLQHLVAQDIAGAADAIGKHLITACEATVDCLGNVPPRRTAHIPGYLTPI